jgi:hypothetical protein
MTDGRSLYLDMERSFATRNLLWSWHGCFLF